MTWGALITCLPGGALLRDHSPSCPGTQKRLAPASSCSPRRTATTRQENLLFYYACLQQGAVVSHIRCVVCVFNMWIHMNQLKDRMAFVTLKQYLPA